MFHLLIALLAGILVEILAVVGFYFTDNNRPFHAATIKMLSTGCVIYVFMTIIKQAYVILPYLLGVWIGGMIGIKLKKRLETTANKST